MDDVYPLSEFLEVISEDGRIRPSHIAIYLALLERWHQDGRRAMVRVHRRELMKRAKVSARGTYHRCMRELQDFGYIRYEPSCLPGEGSLVALRRL